MESPHPQTTQSEPASSVTGTDVRSQNKSITLQITGDTENGETSGYSLLVQGEVEASSILSSTEPEETITLLENDTKLLSGSISSGTVGFILDGTIVAAEFDDPKPTVKADGAVVDPGQWPTVTEYLGHGPGQAPVEDPFPNSGELGATRGDPLNPERYRIELDARGEEPEAYCFDIDGEVIDHADGVTVSKEGERVYGCLCPGHSAEIDIRGVITRIDTADGIEFSVTAHTPEITHGLSN